MNLLRLELPPRFYDYGLLILRLAFGFAFLSLFFTGPGRFSLDAQLQNKKKRVV